MNNFRKNYISFNLNAQFSCFEWEPFLVKSLFGGSFFSKNCHLIIIIDDDHLLDSLIVNDAMHNNNIKLLLAR